MALVAGPCLLFVGCAEDNNANMAKGVAPTSTNPAPPAGPGAATNIPDAGPPPPGGIDKPEYQEYQKKRNQQTYSNYPGKPPG